MLLVFRLGLLGDIFIGVYEFVTLLKFE